MAAQPQFLIDFQEKMDKLTNIRRNIQVGIDFKTQFTNDLKTKLGEISQRLQELARLITDLKTKSDNLEIQVNTNTASISDKEHELQQLKDQIQTLSTERDTLTARLVKQEDDGRNLIATKQAEIDKYEADLRDVKQKLDAQTIQLNALREKMTKTGNEKDVAHSEQLTEQSQKQLQEQEAQLIQRINECEAKIVGFEQQIKDKDTEIIAKQKAIDDATEAAQNAAQGLQKQIDDLKVENEMLGQKLMAATDAINQAADDLENLTNSGPNVKTKQEVDTLLNQITQQIEQSIQNIGSASQGHLPAPINSNIDRATNVTLLDIGNNSNVTMPFGSLIKMLASKSSQIRSGVNKYKNVLDELKGITDVAQISDILRNNNVSVKNNQVMGGRKTKKNRKQKGGFTYKNSKRRSIISRSSLRSSSRKSTRNSR
jgi:chromosome segregation ATPase